MMMMVVVMIMTETIIMVAMMMVMIRVIKGSPCWRAARRGCDARRTSSFPKKKKRSLNVDKQLDISIRQKKVNAENHFSRA